MRPKSWDKSQSTAATYAAVIWVFGALLLAGVAPYLAHYMWGWRAAPIVIQDNATQSPAPLSYYPLMMNSEWPAVTYYRLRNVRVIDGDTLEADIDLPMRVTLRQEMIRCTDYDAWESSKRRRSVNVTDEEVVKGKKATEALKSLIASGQLMVQLEEDDRDVYGRVLARLFVARNNNLLSVADWMEANNHIRKETTNGR